MLGGIRAAQTTWLGKTLTTLFFGLMLLAFVVWGMGDPFKGGSANSVAQVGDVSIPTATFKQEYQRELQDLQRRARRAITTEEAHRIGLDAQVLTRLMSEAVLDDQAGRMDLAMSDAEVAKQVVADPSFAGPAGTFDRGRFDQFLANRGLTEQAFVREQRKGYLRQELVAALVGDLETPQAALEALHRYQAEVRSLDYVTLPVAAAGVIEAPDDAALQTYYDAHKAAFTAPQYRKLVILPVTTATLAKPDAVSDADIQALYDQVKAARFEFPETRAVTQIVFDTEAQAAAFSAKIKAGSTFDDALKADGLQDKAVDLGMVGKAQIIDPAIADAAFALPADGTSDPVKGRFGTAVIHVGAILPAGIKPLAEVEPALKTEIADKRASDAVKALRDKVEAARATGKPLAEVGTSVGVPVTTIDAVDANGLDPAGTTIALPDGKDLLAAAFASGVGVDNDPVATADGGGIWYEVAKVDPARQLSLADAKPKVEAAWREEQTAKQLDAKADEDVKAIESGSQTLEGIASALGLTVLHIGDAKRSGAEGLDAATLAKVFDAKVDGAGSAATGPATRVLFKVLGSTVPVLDMDAADTKQLASRYAVSLQDGIINGYLAVMGAKLGAKVNQAAVQAATSTGY